MIWKTLDGRKIALADLSNDHLNNAIAMTKRNLDKLLAEKIRRIPRGLPDHAIEDELEYFDKLSATEQLDRKP